MRRLIVFCIVASNCLLAQPFFFRKDIPVGERPYAFVVGDFNGDGRPDLAFSAWEGLFVLLNTGGGNFGRPIRMESAGFGAVLATGDFNGDGSDDLVSSRGLLLSRGDGTFLPLRPIDAGDPVAAGDFNRDGKSDLVFRLSRGRGFGVLMGNGDGTFRPGVTLTSATTFPLPPLVADFNRDGRSDVAVFLDYRASETPVPPESPPFALEVFLGQGDGTFAAGIQTPFKSDAVGFTGLFSAADFNADKVPDLATPYGIALGKGDGSFQPPVPYPSWGEGILPVAVADLTGDEKVDLVVRDGADSVFVWPGKGDGTFLPPLKQPVGWGGYLVTAVDLDGDGRVDLVAANYSSNTLTLLMARAQGGPALPRAVSSASDTAVVAPESLATLFAPTPATGSASAWLPWPTRLGGISLEVRDSAGANRLAPLLFVSPTQINFLVPAGTSLGEATIAVIGDRGATQAGSMQVDAAAPGLFLASHTGEVPAATGVLVEPGGTQVQIPVFSCLGASCKAEPIPLSTAGDRPIYLSFHGTGFRGANLENVTCSIGPVVYAGPLGNSGLDQINVRLRPALLEEVEGQLYGPGPVTVTFWIGGMVSNSAVIDLH
jgi:uncharacterized protein (TIGR03437 family)